MLVLTRRVGEKMVVGNEVTIEVLSVSGEVVRLGIAAPRETSVHRFEVFVEIQAANRAAATPPVAAPRVAVQDLAAQLQRAREEAGVAVAATEPGKTASRGRKLSMVHSKAGGHKQR